MILLIASLRIAYVVVLVLVTAILARRTVRAFTSRAQGKDFDYMLFAGLAVNRLWFILRGLVFDNGMTRPGEAASLVASYIFAIAFEVGVLLSLELYEDTYLGSGPLAARLVQDIGLRGVGLNPDVGNLIRLHRPIEDWREIMHEVLPYANFWHVKNYQRDENVARDFYTAVPAPMESGLISYREAVREAISYGFQGVFCTEHYGGDGLSVSASNERYLREKILPRRADYPLRASLVAQHPSELSTGLSTEPLTEGTP